MFTRGLIRFMPSDDALGKADVFCVPKKAGTQRLVLDTRCCNMMFKQPPRMALPTPSAIGRLEAAANEDLHFCAGDIIDAFYGMRVDDAMSLFFRLPKMARQYVERFVPEGLPKGPYLVPCLVVLPMGWAWTLHIFQRVLTRAVLDAGYAPEEIVADRSPGV